MSKTAEFRMITRDLYRAVSGARGRRDWSLADPHFHHEARLVRTGLDEQRTPFEAVMTWEQYKRHADASLALVDFWEEEEALDALVFGAIAHVTSVYRFRRVSDDGTVSGRGMNLFSFVRFSGTWRIIGMIWSNERADLPLPVTAAT